jgi:O-methyltransferase
MEKASPYTMTSPARLKALIDAVRYLLQENIHGNIVECGVWRGGSMLAVALTLEQLGSDDRDLYLFDTYEGMTEPGEEDVDFHGVSAEDQLQAEERSKESHIWCYAGIDDVKRTMSTSNYSASSIHYVVGNVKDTLPDQAPEKIALLRLDTDWYESTRHEMEVLFPRLQPGGILIIDDYGHWQGAKQAVDEYLGRHPGVIELHPIDYTGRIGVRR